MATQNIKRTFLLILYREGKTKTKRKTHLTLVVCFLHLGTLSLPACYPLICLSRHIRHIFFFPLPNQCICCGIQSHKTHLGQNTFKTAEYSLLRQWVQEESVPNKDPDVSERPSFIPPPPPRDWLHVSNLFVVYD